MLKFLSSLKTTCFFSLLCRNFDSVQLRIRLQTKHTREIFSKVCQSLHHEDHLTVDYVDLFHLRSRWVNFFSFLTLLLFFHQFVSKFALFLNFFFSPKDYADDLMRKEELIPGMRFPRVFLFVFSIFPPRFLLKIIPLLFSKKAREQQNNPPTSTNPCC